MSAVYMLTGPRKGQTVVLLNRYRFEAGAMIVSDDEANKIEALMDFYSAKRFSLEEYETAMAQKLAAETVVATDTKPVKAAKP